MDNLDSGLLVVGVIAGLLSAYSFTKGWLIPAAVCAVIVVGCLVALVSRS